MNKTEAIKVVSIKNETTGVITMSFAEKKWGPVISGTDEKEMKIRFLMALSVACIVRSILETNELYKKSLVGKDIMESKAKEVKEEIEKIQKEFALA